MSRAPADPLPPPPRPTVLDYFFLLTGAGLSLLLLRLSPLSVNKHESAPPALGEWIPVLPEAMRLTEGILLLWPFFYGLQRLLGRRQGLTAGEWLWVLSWVGVALLTGLAAWGKWGSLPEFVQPYADTPRRLWYVIVVPSMAALAVLLLLGGLVRRRPTPWTHPFSLALMIWPVLPLAGVLTFGKFE